MQNRTSQQKKILLVHLVSNGDCLYVTAIARQIKLDYPGCELTWIISNLASQVLRNNQFVDMVEIWPVKSVREAMFSSWYALKESLKLSGAESKYDHIFSTQFFPHNAHFFDGTIRSTLLRSYPHKIKDVTPHIHLTAGEISNAADFAARYRLKQYSKIVMFECTPGSGQSFITPDIAVQISEKLLDIYPDMVIVLSTHLNLPVQHERIIVANTISFRENAELAKYCNLFIGTSSGITWLLTSDWLKEPISSIQLLSRAKGISFASVRYDFKYWGLPHNHIVEIFTPEVSRVIDCVNLFYEKGMPACITQYNEAVKPDPIFIKDYFNIVAKRKNLSLLFGLFRNFADRNGFSLRLMFAFCYIYIQGMIRIPYVLFLKQKNADQIKF